MNVHLPVVIIALALRAIVRHAGPAAPGSLLARHPGPPGERAPDADIPFHPNQQTDPLGGGAHLPLPLLALLWAAADVPRLLRTKWSCFPEQAGDEAALTTTVTSTRARSAERDWTRSNTSPGHLAARVSVRVALESECMPSPGGQINRTAEPAAGSVGGAVGGQGAASRRPLRGGYHVPARGQSLATTGSVGCGAALGPARGRSHCRRDAARL